MTDKPTPTDVEIDALWRFEASKNWDSTLAMRTGFARAVLAKWGTPATGGEPAGTVGYTVHGTQYVNWRTKPPAHGTPIYTTPQPTQAQAAESVPAVGEVAEHYRNAIASACEGWTMPDGLRKHLETALWSPPTPQPTQAQAGAVPLDEARRLFDAGWKAAALFCDREDVVADGIIGFGACPQFEAAFSAANGIKGASQ